MKAGRSAGGREANAIRDIGDSVIVRVNLELIDRVRRERFGGRGARGLGRRTGARR